MCEYVFWYYRLEIVKVKERKGKRRKGKSNSNWQIKFENHNQGKD